MKFLTFFAAEVFYLMAPYGLLAYLCEQVLSLKNSFRIPSVAERGFVWKKWSSMLCYVLGGTLTSQNSKVTMGVTQFH